MNEVFKQLQKLVKAKNQKQVAADLGISQSYLHDILKGRRSIDGIAAKLGYEKKVSYLKK